ncbi:hypothetical protein ACVW2L_003285 [Mucilaginibacter sp. HD30]
MKLLVVEIIVNDARNHSGTNDHLLIIDKSLLI